MVALELLAWFSLRVTAFTSEKLKLRTLKNEIRVSNT
jgi:hypothetical protein